MIFYPPCHYKAFITTDINSGKYPLGRERLRLTSVQEVSFLPILTSIRIQKL
jgi:hypothetical protein